MKENTIDIRTELLTALTQALEQVPQFIMVIDQGGTVEYVNRTFETKTGYAQKDIVGKPASILKSEGESFHQLWSTIQRSGAPRDVFISVRKNGSLLREYLRISPLFDNQGQIVRFIAVGTEMAPRSYRNGELRRQITAFQKFAANFPGIVYRVRLRKNAKAQLFGKGVAALIGQPGIDAGPYCGFPIHVLMAPDDRERRETVVEDAVRRGAPFELEYRIERAGGGIRHCLEYGMPVHDLDGKSSEIYGTIFDISKRRTLQESERALEELSARLLTLQEDERKRIARELHDGIGQMLTSIKMQVEAASSIITRHGFEPETEALRAVVPLIREAIRDVRNMSQDLRPPILDDLGIIATIVWFCRNFPKAYESVRVEMDIDVDETAVPPALKTVIYRVLQEAMNNIGKHAKATIVWVRLLKTVSGLEFLIEDNGCGFNLQETTPGRVRGLGLASMQERVKTSGGDFSIQSTQRIGTVVRAAWSIHGALETPR